MGCDHCGETFDSRRAEIDHVLADHGSDLTSHERDALKRERNELPDTSGSVADRLPIGRGTAMAALFLGLAAVVLYGMVSAGVVSFTAGGSPSGTATAPTSVGPAGSTHEHATFSVSVAGDRIDFSRQRYQMQANRVHFEAGDGTTIHKHATGVTIGYALDTLGLGINASCLQVHGDAYCEPAGDLAVTVDGSDIDAPTDHVIRDGETIRIRYTEN